MRIIHKQQGDTIIEVLIAIAVIAVVLAGAYVTTNRSLNATRAAQERSNGLKIVESQIEQLKSFAKTDPATLFAASGTFCVVGGAPPTLPASSNAACKVNSSGAPTIVQPQYSISITRSGNTFTVQNQWTNVSGRTTEQLQMVYRLYD